jgi:hypothetical protein
MSIVRGYFYLHILVTFAFISIVISFVSESQKMQTVFGQVQSNFTSTVCNADGTCITTVCINNEPCQTVKSNSTAGKDKDNSTTNQNNTSPLTGLKERII